MLGFWSELCNHNSWLGAGGIGTKTNSADNCSWVGVGTELGNKVVIQGISLLTTFLNSKPLISLRKLHISWRLKLLAKI